MTRTILQLLTATTGSVGFGLVFHVKEKYLPAIAVDGFLSWFVYILCRDIGGMDLFFCMLLASLVVDLFAEVLARYYRAPSTTFFVPGVITLIPGSTLYYCMRSVVESNVPVALRYGWETFLSALGIAAGMSISWTLCYLMRKLKR